MKRSELEHVIRASANIANDDEIVIVGSQAILGQFPDAPTDLLVSVEADVYPKNHPERAELIDGSIGELSPFHDTFGYYAQGVGPETATLPVGWESRLVPICNANTRGATGLCLEVHDLVLAKYVANRDKDRRFIVGAIRHRLVREQELLARVPTLPVDAAVRDRAAAQIRLDFSSG
jgi:uncharacterized nucleotidyltransferase DUF6036